MSECRICQTKISKRSNYCTYHKNKKLVKKCGICQSDLVDKNKTGFCFKHMPRSGVNNPMAGRSVYSVWLEKYGKEEADRRQEQAKMAASKASKKMWKNDDYRNLIKDTTTGLKRSSDFKRKQRDNAIKQFKNPAQRELRSIAIRESFKRGTHNADNMMKNCYDNRGFNEDGVFYASDVERKRMAFLKEAGVNWKRYEVTDFDFRLLYEWEGKTHLYLPDFVIYNDDGSVIIEEMKYDLKRISEIEKYKADIAFEYFENIPNINYRIIDDPLSKIF